MAGQNGQKFNILFISVFQIGILLINVSNGAILSMSELSNNKHLAEHSSVFNANNTEIIHCKNIYSAGNPLNFTETNSFNNSTHFPESCLQVTNETYTMDLTTDGYLQVSSKDTDMFYPPRQFCATSNVSAKLCQSLLTPVVWRKCCPEHQVLSSTLSKTCINSTMRFRPEMHDNGDLHFYSFMVKRGNNNIVNSTCPAGYYFRKLSSTACTGDRSIARRDKGWSILSLLWDLDDIENDSHSCDGCKFRLRPNGSISYEDSTGVFLRKTQWKTVKPDEELYCIDGVIKPSTQNCKHQNRKNPDSISESSNKVTVTDSQESYDINDCISGDGVNDFDKNYIKLSEMSTTVMYICLPNVDDASDKINNKNVAKKTIFLAVIWILTCPLLFGAALGNFFMIQRNVHGWILSCYLLSMCLLNILSAILILNVSRTDISASTNDQQAQQSLEDERDLGGCHPVDFAIKFTYMSTLCWMTSINFGLWKTFRYTLPNPVGLRRFIMSVLFSLGFPLISVTVSYYMAYLGSNSCERGYCLLFSYNTIPYFQFPIFLLVFGNLALFLKTSWRIATLRNEAADILQKQAQDHLKSFALFAKLFLLTGSIWLIRLALFVLQIHGLYLSLYGILLETAFSIPELIFPMIVFHHPEFIKWSWTRAPRVSGLIVKVNPFFKNIKNKQSIQLPT